MINNVIFDQMNNGFGWGNYYYNSLKFMFNFIKKHLKLFVITSVFIFAVLSIGIPLSLRSLDGIDVIAKNEKEKVFAIEAVKEAYSFLNEPFPFAVLRVKLVKIASDVPTCKGGIVRYVAFIKGYSLFNISFIGAVIESSDIVSRGAAAGMTMHLSEFEVFKRSPSDLYSCSFSR